jgi:GNAT superfamily N-acetyltransferase
LIQNKGIIVAAPEFSITPIDSKKDRAAFVDYVYVANAGDPSFVPQLRGEEIKKYTPGQNPFFEHARCQLFLARDAAGKVVGRISAHIDELALAQPVEQGMGPGTGMWGALDADSQAITHALIARAEDWLRGQGMTRVLAPITLSIWEEPGLLVKGHDHPPTYMMGHDAPKYQPWIEAAGYTPAKKLFTYDLDITQPFPPLLQRIIASGEKNARIKVRNVELKHFDREVGIICDILNDAWSDNWGFVPFTPSEIAYTAKNLKILVKPDLIQIAEYDGEAVAFMMTLPDLNQPQKRFVGPKGNPSPLGWIRLLWWLMVRTKPADMRVPLMGVRKKLQSTRMASQLAFMMIEFIRRAAVKNYAGKRGEIGWILDDNQGMNSIAREIHSTVNKEYQIYQRDLA